LCQLPLLSPLPKEIILVDGGSQDERAIAAKYVFESFSGTVKTKLLNRTIAEVPYK
jgi:glycosyltransferase involved in cell wall biosynthesis